VPVSETRSLAYRPVVDGGRRGLEAVHPADPAAGDHGHHPVDDADGGVTLGDAGVFQVVEVQPGADDIGRLGRLPGVLRLVAAAGAAGPVLRLDPQQGGRRVELVRDR
jgi:hypothetical protein